MIVSPHQKLNIVVDTCFYFKSDLPISVNRSVQDQQLTQEKGRKNPSYIRYINNHLLLALAELPSINAIIFPSIVADWEILGGLTDAKGEYHQIRRNDAYGTETRQAKEWFFQQCNRGRISVGGDGQYGVEEVGGRNQVFNRQQKHPKLWVLDTPEHMQILENLLRKKDSYFSIDDINGALQPNAGEHSCMDIAQQLPWDGQVLFLSDDIKYMRTLSNNMCFTPFAQPIAHSSSFSFWGTLAGLHHIDRENEHPRGKRINRLSHSYFSNYFSKISGQPVDMRELLLQVCPSIKTFAPERLYDSCGVKPYYLDGNGERKYTQGLHDYIGASLMAMGWPDPQTNQLPLSTADIKRDEKTDLRIEVAFNKAARIGKPVTPLPKPIPRPKLVINKQQSNMM
ncbi:MAG: hypothetical protein ACOYK8_08490 [Alphaproteobacteria bacterium]